MYNSPMRFLWLSVAFAACTPSSKATDTGSVEPVGVLPQATTSGATSTVAAPIRGATAVCRATNPPKGVVEHRGPPGAADEKFSGCQSDAECSKATERCVTVRTHPRDGRPTNKCTDDACFRDVDCPTGHVCACGKDEVAHRNSCVPGNCQVDTDCGGFTCSTSWIPGDRGLSHGRYCRSIRDLCKADADCSNAKCIFKDGAFRCGQVPLPKPG